MSQETIIKADVILTRDRHFLIWILRGKNGMRPYKRWRGVKNLSLPPVAYLTRVIAKVSVPDGGLSLSRVVLFEALDK